jgi:hypothetical protein
VSKVVWLAICGVALLAFVGSASATVIASASSSGPRATTVGTAMAPAGRSLSVRVTTKPSQKVKVSWDTICSQNLSPKTAAGQFVARAPLTHAIKNPAPHAKSCIVSATATLTSSGVLLVEILAT